MKNINWNKIDRAQYSYRRKMSDSMDWFSNYVYKFLHRQNLISQRHNNCNWSCYNKVAFLRFANGPTVGCYSHVMTVNWYFWHVVLEDYINEPGAKFKDIFKKLVSIELLSMTVTLLKCNSTVNFNRNSSLQFHYSSMFPNECLNNNWKSYVQKKHFREKSKFKAFIRNVT